MRIRMRTNLGTVHAKEIGVNAGECQAGNETVVNDDAGRWLVKNRLADEIPPDEHSDMHAVPTSTIDAIPPDPVKPTPLSGRGKKSFEKSTPDKDE